MPLLKSGLAVVLFALTGAPSLLSQSRDPSALVIVTGQQAGMPIPTFMEGPANLTANADVADERDVITIDRSVEARVQIFREIVCFSAPFEIEGRPRGVLCAVAAELCCAYLLA